MDNKREDNIINDNIIKDYIYIYKYSIPDLLCDEIIEKFENEKDAKYKGVTAGGLNENTKKTTDFIIPNNELWLKTKKFLENELFKHYLIYIENFKNKKAYNDFYDNTPYVPIYNYLESHFFSLQIQKYNKNDGKYIYHHDFSIDFENKKYRVVTFIWYLNDVDEGGETFFFENIKIKPEKGKIVLFPASWTFPHAGNIPISNDKYIITGWLYVTF
jgi:hypothetical protein